MANSGSPNPFDTTTGYSGQDYRVEREREEARRDPSSNVAATADTALQPDDGAMPPENGRRAWVDPATGSVHGSGAGAGGGNRGEDFDDDPQGGSGYVSTGTGDGGPAKA